MQIKAICSACDGGRLMRSPVKGRPARADVVHEIRHDSYRLIVRRTMIACACSPAAVTIGQSAFRVWWML
jgi:hypothetical protein